MVEKKKILEYACYISPFFIFSSYIVNLNRYLAGNATINPSLFLLAVLGSVIIICAGYCIRINKEKIAKVLAVICTLLMWFLLIYILALVNFNSAVLSNAYNWLRILFVTIITIFMLVLLRQSHQTTSVTIQKDAPNIVNKISKNIPLGDLQPFLPHIDRLIQNQPKPLESLDDFYTFLELEKFTLTPELKTSIRKRIEDILEEKESNRKKQEISVKLFGTPAAPTLPPSQLVSVSQVVPLPTVPPGSTCQICLSEFSSAEPGAVKCPHCNNIFHYRCIAKWVNKNGTCPVCKKELKA